jgi:hypothetical protein
MADGGKKPLRVTPVVIRSRMMLEVATELVRMGRDEWPYPQLRIDMREQGGTEWKTRLFASDAPVSIPEVAEGGILAAIVNPSGALTMACRGAAPFQRPLPLCAISVIPSWDQFGFAVSPSTGLTSLRDIAAKRYPLRVSLRGNRPGHATLMMMDAILRASGFSLDDLKAWGGEVRYDHGLPVDPNFPWGPHRIDAVPRGEVDALFDEGLPAWANRALELGMRFLPLDEEAMRPLEAMGMRRAHIRPADYPGLKEEVLTVDFSGWPVYTSTSAPDAEVRAFCIALEAAADRIPWEGTGPLPIDRMVQNTPDTPLDVPFHPAAEKYWRERGYLR